MTDIDLGRIAFEKHIELNFFEHPRLGLRTATWDELTETGRDQWRQVAAAVIEAG